MGIKDERPREGANIVRTGAELARATQLDRDLAEQLIERTRREGVNPVGEGVHAQRPHWVIPGARVTFTDPMLCAAIVDRLAFGGNIIETGTDSYRLAHAKTQQATG
jgi:hypothetical protein